VAISDDEHAFFIAIGGRIDIQCKAKVLTPVELTDKLSRSKRCTSQSNALSQPQPANNKARSNAGLLRPGRSGNELGTVIPLYFFPLFF